ncbi:PepSY domain-containing protein [Paremcibacter congregatus]|uniref:PepSY domain-containing protein n=1 Tax=Paremcibacter congregatus TaxID=2043170 RepID=UPI0030EC22B4|tara:strand:- start:6795 stop:7571 length:777 start_codon:yes stop_codon:yes gene_type:complete
MAQHPQNNRNGRQKTIRRWHRRVGYASLLLVMILSITGLILNRTEKLGLNQITIQNKIVSALYGLAPDAPAVHFPLDGHWVSWLDGRLYYDNKLIAQNSPRPGGATQLQEIFAVAATDRLSLYLMDGSLLETLDQAALPGPITHLGRSPDRDLIIDSQGVYYNSPDDFLSWTRQEDLTDFIPSEQAPAPAPVVEAILQDYQGQGISLYKIILDLHSGHIFGAYGPYLMDLAAISLIFLGITGLMKRRQNGKNKRRNEK